MKKFWENFKELLQKYWQYSMIKHDFPLSTLFIKFNIES